MNKCSFIVSNGLSGAHIERSFSKGHFFFCLRLFPDIGESLLIVSGEDHGGDLSAEVAIDAAHVIVESSFDVEWVFVGFIGHVGRVGGDINFFKFIILIDYCVLRMNETSSQIDLYALSLLRLVARHRSFTAASKEAGISQSALTRQVQGLEERLGVKVFERTTRLVKLTEAGAVFLRETEALPHILEGAVRRVREEYLGAAREVKVGLSQGLALAHIPGIFHSGQKDHLGQRVRISQSSDDELLQQVAQNELDLGIISRPQKVPDSILIRHEMEDEFCLIAPEGIPVDGSFAQWAKSKSWILPPAASISRELIDGWAKSQKLTLRGSLELENIDLTNEFVALGFGVAFVPRRSLTSLMRKHRIQRVPIPKKLSRQLVAIVPKHGTVPEHVSEFVDGILFS